MSSKRNDDDTTTRHIYTVAKTISGQLSSERRSAASRISNALQGKIKIKCNSNQYPEIRWHQINNSQQFLSPIWCSLPFALLQAVAGLLYLQSLALDSLNGPYVSICTMYRYVTCILNHIDIERYRYMMIYACFHLFCVYVSVLWTVYYCSCLSFK